MQRPTIVIVLLSLISAVLIIIRLFVLAELGAMNYEYAEIIEETAQVKRENKVLREQVLYHSSLMNIKKQAVEQGFVTPSYKDFIHLQ